MDKNTNKNFYKDIYVGKYGNKNEIANQAGYILELCDMQSGLLASLNKKSWIKIEKELMVIQGDVPKNIDEKLLDEIAETKYTLYSAKRFFVSKKTKETKKAHLEEIEKTL